MIYILVPCNTNVLVQEQNSKSIKLIFQGPNVWVVVEKEEAIV